MNKDSVAAVLGIDPTVAAELPVRIGRDSFFKELAKLGISPQTEDEAIDLLVASDNLEAKRAEFRAAANPVNRGLQVLLGKTAAAPQRAAQQAAQQEEAELTAKVASYLNDPMVYGALLSLTVDR